MPGESHSRTRTNEQILASKVRSRFYSLRCYGLISSFAFPSRLILSSWKVVDSYRLAVYECIHASVLIPIVSTGSNLHRSSYSSSSTDGSVGGSSTDVFSAFSLVPFALRLFAVGQGDSSIDVRELSSRALRTCQALVHPRALPLAMPKSIFVHDAGLTGSGGQEDGSASYDSNLSSGLIRGRDGSLYMEMKPVPTASSVQREEIVQVTHAPPPTSATTTPAVVSPMPSVASQVAPPVSPALVSSSISSTLLPATAIPSLTTPLIPSSTSTATHPPPSINATATAARVSGSKRSRESSDDDTIEASSSKRAHIENSSVEEVAEPVVESSTNHPVDAAQSAPAASSSTPASTLPSMPSGGGGDEDDDAVPIVADDGPDEDEGEQGSLWTL